MKKYISILSIGALSLITAACTTTTGSYGPGNTTYTTYVGYNDPEEDALFYSGYQTGYDPSSIYWQNYRDYQGNWGQYGSYGGGFSRFYGGRR